MLTRHSMYEQNNRGEYKSFNLAEILKETFFKKQAFRLG